MSGALARLHGQLISALFCVLALGGVLLSCTRAEESADAQDRLSLYAGSHATFRRGAQTFGEARVFGVAVADADLDGDSDFLVANYIGPSRLFLNDGGGQFAQSEQTFESSSDQRAHDVEMADLNGDTLPDVVMVCHNAPSRVFLNGGLAGFTGTGQAIGAADDKPQSVVLGDVDCDGDVDMFLVYARAPNRLWRNDGRGHFSRSDVDYGGTTCHKLDVADFNGDAFADLFLGFLAQPGEIWLNDGTGRFSDSNQAVGDEAGCDHVDCGDIDGDGDTDLAVANIENGVTIWLNSDGGGRLVRRGPSFSPGTIHLQLVDVDSDGDMDLLTSNIQEGNRLWMNDGTGLFTPTNEFLGTTWAFCFGIGRLDSDDAPDVIIGNEVDGLGATAIYFGDPAGHADADDAQQAN
jgi:hypothetical protein